MGADLTKPKIPAASRPIFIKPSGRFAAYLIKPRSVAAPQPINQRLIKG
jgi:hypothetical protein